MQTLKTALVVTFLLALLYGVFITLNKPEGTGELDAQGDPQQWAGPDLQLGEATGGAPDFGPAELGEPTALPPRFSQANASDFPLPSFGSADAGTASSQRAPVTDPYSNQISAPPLSEGGSSPRFKDDDHLHSHDHDHEGHGHVRSSVYGGSPPADPTMAVRSGTREVAAADPSSNDETSPYENSRSERVSADDFSASASDPGPNYQPHNLLTDEPAAGNTDSRASLAEYQFKQAWAEAQSHLNENQFARALATLTSVYRESDLSAEHRQKLLDMLDRLAGTVIYSTEHRLEPPYEVARGETLDQIAGQFSVPTELLLNINRSSVNEPDLLLPGTQLKVMRGPFKAEIEISRGDPSRGEATLFLGSLYAGRFPVTFGNDMPTPGRTYQVTERLEGKPYYQATGPTIEARSPTNPYGLHWLGFGETALGIHALGRHGGLDDPRGSIRLSERDAADVYGILSVGSTVTVLQ